jgi:integrase/recombinase XerD
VRVQIERFLEHITSQNYATNTVLAYRSDLEQLLDYLERRDKQVWTQVVEEDIRGHLVLLWEREYAPSTVVRKMAAVSSFFRFLVMQSVIHDDPTSGISVRQAARPSSADVLTGDELGQLLLHLSRDRTPKGLRDQVLLGLMARAGFRPSELVALDLDDVESLSNRLGTQGHTSLQALLQRYATEDRCGLDPSEDESALFPSVGVGTGGGRLTRQGVWLIVKERAAASGLNRQVSPRSLRRTHLAHHSG